MGTWSRSRKTKGRSDVDDDKVDLYLTDQGAYFAAIPNARGVLVSRDRTVIVEAERKLNAFQTMRDNMRDFARHVLDRPTCAHHQGGSLPQTFEEWSSDLIRLAKDARELLGKE